MKTETLISIEFPESWYSDKPLFEDLPPQLATAADVQISFKASIEDRLRRLADEEREIYSDFERKLHRLALQYQEEGAYLRREMELSSEPSEKAILGSKLDFLMSRLSSWEYETKKRIEGQRRFLNDSSSLANFSSLGPHEVAVYGQHLISIINAVVKTPVGAAFLSASATQIVNSIANWVRSKRPKEKFEVRLFGPDGQLIDREKA